MRNPIALLVILVLAGPAIASQEQIHPWKSLAITASTTLFGDVEIKATADAKGNVKTLDVVVKGKTITVPAKWIASLPAMPLASLEIRSERGYDAEPYLYAFFRNGPAAAKGTVDLHIAFYGGKLKDASTTTHDGTGKSKLERKPAP